MKTIFLFPDSAIPSDHKLKPRVSQSSGNPPVHENAPILCQLWIISHQPPYKTELDKVMVFKHIGCKSLRNYIEEQKPLLCLCGHIHEAIGIDEIGKTRIVNPGSFRAGKYAKIEIDKLNVNVELKSV